LNYYESFYNTILYRVLETSKSIFSVKI